VPLCEFVEVDAMRIDGAVSRGANISRCQQ
jgi:hypothetical protein